MSLKKVRSGERLRIAADHWNTLVDVAQRQRDRAVQRVNQPAPYQSLNNGLITVRNDTGVVLPRFAIVGLGEPIIDPADNEAAFDARPVLSAVEPDAALHATRFAICQQPLGLELIGTALVAGVTPLTVAVQSANDGFAQVSTGETAQLQSAADGPVRILWKADGTGPQRAVVLMPVGGSAPNLMVSVHQVAHNFSAGSVVYFDGATWLTAEPDMVDAFGSSAKIGLVWSVTDADRLSILVWGRVQLPTTAGGVPMVVSADSTLWLTSGGGLTSTEPNADTIVQCAQVFADGWAIWQPQVLRKIEICIDGAPADYWLSLQAVS